MALEPILLVLDLDETLVHVRRRPLAHAPDFEAFSLPVYVRPFAREFLQACSAEFRLAVWTSSSRDYAEMVVGRLFDGIALEFVWAHERCTARFDPETHEVYWVKNLKKVKSRGFDLRRTLMLDDTPRKLERSYGNHIRVAPFEGDPRDDELPALLEYLRRFRGLEDVRPPEKRGWRLSL